MTSSRSTGSRPSLAPHCGRPAVEVQSNAVDGDPHCQRLALPCKIVAASAVRPYMVRRGFRKDSTASKAGFNKTMELALLRE
eukprot:5466508-Pleurochrysis_carterae.AAC.6